MRAIIITFALALAGLSQAQAADTRFKPATENQILRHISGASKLKTAKNGFGYKPGNPNGYKISHGKICVLAPRRNVDCVTVRTNGEKFEMIDRLGNRQNF